MEKIKELVGIIEGINYDNVINQLEIQELKTWIEKNKSISYDPNFKEIISKIQNILLDNRIDENEKEYLLELLEKYHKNNNISESINTLHGIIEGITCDNVINELEILNLEEWLENNTHLQGNQTYDSIYNAVEKILEDGIVTKEEQEYLIKLLSKPVVDSKSNMRIDYIKKLIKNHRNIGVELIELIDDETMIQKIHDSAIKELRRILRGYAGFGSADTEIIFISLVLIALLNYDSNFYDYVEKTYTNLYDIYSAQRIEGLIRSVIDKYRLVERQAGARIINTVLMNAIVPQHYLVDYYDFIYDIYRLNFNYCLNDNLYEEFQFIFEGLKDSLSNTNEDDFQLNVTRKTYRLIKSTKMVIAEDYEHMDSIIKLSSIIIKLIDKKHWESKKFEIYNPYFRKGYDDWVKKYSNNREGRGERTTFVSRWEPEFEMEGKVIRLIPPIHKIRQSDGFWNIYVEVRNNGKVIYTNTRPIIKEIIGGYQITVNPIVINNPLGTLEYIVNNGEKEIYHSKNKLYREVLVFNTKGNEVKNNTDYSGDAIFCYKNENKYIQQYAETPFYKIGFLKVDESMVIPVDNTVFSFSRIMKPGLIGDDIKDLFVLDDEDRIQVYTSIKQLMFQTDTNENYIGVRINNKESYLSSYKYNKSIQQNGTIKYIVNLEISEYGIYTIELFNLKTRKRLDNCSFKCAIDPNYELDKLKIDDNLYVVEVSSKFYGGKLYRDIEIPEFYLDNFKFTYQHKRYTYLIPFGIPMYRMDNQSWNPLSWYIWIHDVKLDGYIELFGVDAESIRVIGYKNEAITLEEFEVTSKNGIIKFNSGFLKTYSSEYDYVDIMWVTKEKHGKGIRCYNKCVLNEKETIMEFNPKTGILSVSLSYFGRGNIELAIKNDEKIEIFKKDNVQHKELIEITGLQSLINYHFIISEKQKGFSLKSSKLLKEYTKEFCSYEALCGKVFQIDEVDFFTMNKKLKKMSKKTWHLKDTFVLVNEYLDERKFKGNVFQRLKNGNFRWKNDINPVEVEIVGEEVGRVLELAITKDGDGLLLDFDHSTINDTLDNRDLPDIYTYTARYNER